MTTLALGRPAKQDREAATLVRLGLSREEAQEARGLFQERLRDCPGRDRLSIEDVDLVLRQLRVYVSLRYVTALFLEIDENANGAVEEEEFLMMVSKLRGRLPLSVKFYAATVPQSLRERCAKVFAGLDADQNGFITEDQMVAGFRAIYPHVNKTDEELQRLIEQVNGCEGATPDEVFGYDDFLAMQARLGPPPIFVDAAQYSLSEEEVEAHRGHWATWRASKNLSVVSPQELRAFLAQLGLQVSWNRIREILEEAGLDSIASMEAKHFVYLVVRAGGGTCTRPRLVLRPGASYDEAFRIGLPLEELWELGYNDLLQIRLAGWGAKALYRGGFADAAQLRQAGFAARELRHLGLDAMELRFAGFSLDELRNSGFSSEVLRDCARASGCGSRPNTANGGAECRIRPRGGLLAALALGKLRAQGLTAGGGE